MVTNRKNPDVKFYEPSRNLRQKIGVGGIDPRLLTKAEEQLNNHDFDFMPMADSMFMRLERAIADIERGKVEGRDAVEILLGPIMELKGSGGMFGYPLVSEIAEVAMNFLENIPELHRDAMEIVKIHQASLKVILLNKIKGEGGREGRSLAKELYAACLRYYKKYDIEPKG